MNKNNKIRIYFLVITIALHCLFCLPNGFSQQVTTDSLEFKLNNTKDIPSKILIYNELFLAHEYTDSKKANSYLNLAVELAKKINNKEGLALTYLHFGYFHEDNGDYKKAYKYHLASLNLYKKIGKKKEIADSYYHLALFYRASGNYNAALKYHSIALEISKKIKNKVGMAASYLYTGVVYIDLGNYPLALKHFFQAKKFYEELNNFKGICDAYSRIANIYELQKDYKIALDNYKLSLAVAKKNGFEDGVTIAYSNLGQAYCYLGQHEKSLKCSFYAAKINEANNFKLRLAINYNNIGIAYKDQAFHEQNQNEKIKLADLALNYFYKSLEIDTEMNNAEGIACLHVNLASAYIIKKDYKKAEELLQKGEKLSMELQHKELIRNAYEMYTELNSNSKNYKAAFEYHKLFIAYSDSLTNEETKKKNIQNQMTYEFEKKEAVAKAEHKKELQNQKVIASEKSRKQKIVIMFVVCGLLLVGVFAGFIFRSLRKTKRQKKIIEEQKLLVEQQKHEVILQKQLVEEQQKEVMDSIRYAKRIQMALLPSHKYIDRNLRNFID